MLEESQAIIFSFSKTTLPMHLWFWRFWVFYIFFDFWFDKMAIRIQFKFSLKIYFLTFCSKINIWWRILCSFLHSLYLYPAFLICSCLLFFFARTWMRSFGSPPPIFSAQLFARTSQISTHKNSFATSLHNAIDCPRQTRLPPSNAKCR